ncbi:MAG: UxaA family hydrolase [Verrucomicrobiota bacterium]
MLPTAVNTTFAFLDVARLAESWDNVAIATRRLEAGSEIRTGERTFTLSHTVLEGHRFAVDGIPQGYPLLSWGLPFGVALRDIDRGEYLCNEKMLAALAMRYVDFTLPAAPNFRDQFARYELDEKRVHCGEQVPRYAETRCFAGFARPGNRGVGTRNFIAVLGTTSRTASLARAIADRFKDAQFPNLDGVVAIAHTEGGGETVPNNLDFTLRTLAGFMVHSNIGAVLAVDLGTEVITNAMLRDFMRENGYPLDDVAHRFISVGGDFASALAQGESIVRGWLEPVNACQRAPHSLAHLKVSLQCGGSDAFSGVSGNPLAGWISREVIRYGGSANLAETDELIGAEPYVLHNVRDLATAREFLRLVDRFETWAGWHGHSAEGNPSGGNLYRGLYNIAVKSIGAARKKAPDVRLDYAIEYGAPMREHGFYFMDSPGNDLESIAGQVASGCNIILFTTGNGSITNFPFVPTIKIMTNTNRFNLLSRDMDVNAGRYLDGVSMDQLGAEAFDYTVKVASGMKSIGEKAGHSQVQLWREWRQRDKQRLAQLQSRPQPNGEPIALRPGATNNLGPLHFKALPARDGVAADQIGLIVPTSLCSGQIAQIIAARLNASPRPNGVSRYVALAHTEGCGNSRGESETLYVRTMVGYLRHPTVRHGLLLEHGCEKTHNDEIRHYLADHAVDPSSYGWASIQMDGGIDKVVARVANWFETQAARSEAKTVDAGLGQLRLGLTSVGAVPAETAQAFALIARAIATAGGTVVIPANATLLNENAFTGELFMTSTIPPSLAYGQIFTRPGLHVMETQTDHYIETLTGVGATGVDIILAHVERALQAHPMIPVLQVASANSAAMKDIDFTLGTGTAIELAKQLLSQVLAVASREYTPKALTQGNTDFQITRGWFGVSL